MRFNDERGPKCEICKAIHAGKEPPEEPPCESKCQVVTLYPANDDVASVYMMCRGQVITVGMGQVIDINLQAVKVACDVLGIKNQADVMKRVRSLFLKLLSEKDNVSLPEGAKDLMFL